MRSRAFVVAVAAASALVVATSAFVATAAEKGSAAQGAKTTITIAPYEDGLLGTVSSKAERCVSDRKVKVFRQRGDKQQIDQILRRGYVGQDWGFLAVDVGGEQ